MRQIALFLSLLLLAPLADLSAQEATPAVFGARVRITTLTLNRIRWSRNEVVKEGTLVALNADTLLLKTNSQSAPLKIPLPTIAKFEVSKGQRRSVGKGAGSGLFVGGGVGVVLGAMFGDCDPGDPECPPGLQRDLAISGGVALGVLGAVIGAGIGAFVRAEQWERVPKERIRVGISPQRHGGVRLAASFNF